MAGTPVSGEVLTHALARRTDADLAALLQTRPDLATPAPSSLTALAARAASRPSVERALALLDRFQLTVAESLVVLTSTGTTTPEAVGTALAEAGGTAEAVGTPLAEAVGTALEVPAAAVGTVLDRLEELALTVDGAPLLGLAEALGPHPAGLGPPLADLPRPDAGHPPTTPDAVAGLLRDAPPAARRTLEALAWGPPVGTLGAGGENPGARWLLEHGVLHPLSPTQLVLPLEVGLAVRGGRTHRDVAVSPPAADTPTRPAAVVAAEGARAAEDLVRVAGALLSTWAQDPPVALRNGGLGVRELRRAAAVLEVDQPRVATLVELLGTAGLVAPYETGEESLWAPTVRAESWVGSELGEQWADLAEAWWSSARTPWLVGTRNDQGALRAALEPGLERGWARRLRRRTLEALATLPDGAAPTTDQVHALLQWHAPRATPPEAAVGAVLTEAGLLGLTGAGALTRAGRALLTGEDAAGAMTADLPDPVAELLVQGDLTGVVPGRPDPELGALLEQAAEVESRGSALTVRFTPASVRRAMDGGMDGEELLAALRRFSRTPLPQPLEYLVTDTARRHGQVRVGVAGSYVRVQDATVAGELQNHPDLAVLQLRQVAPTVLISTARPAELLEALRAAGTAPVLEGPSGAVVVNSPRAGRPARPAAPRGAERVHVRRPSGEELLDLVQRMRAGEDRARRSAAQRASGGPARTDPVHALAILREAARAGGEVDLVLVGATGEPQQRRVRPLSVDAGRVRIRDVRRDAEITVAIHRISAVAPA